MNIRVRRSTIAVGLSAAAVLAVAALFGMGTSGAAPATYRLPWPSGPENEQAVMQGIFESDGLGGCESGCATHQNKGLSFAWDFNLAESTPVLAARSGTVALVQGSWSPDHCGVLPGDTKTRVGHVADPSIGNQANFVLIDHGDETSALYLHLSVVDAAIEQKAKDHETVDQGELLGLSGKTGLTGCRPHLHFQVQSSARADWFTDSIPVHFVDADVVARTPDGVPVEGESYVSDNQMVAVAPSAAP